MAITIRKGLLGKQDIRFYTAASPIFYRTSSAGNATPITALAATHIPITNASGYYTVNNLERASKEVISRYFSKNHSIATYPNGARVGDHVNVFGFRNAGAATSIQAAASNSFLRDGVARIVIPDGTYSAATPINIPRKSIIFGNGQKTIIRASSTIQTSRIFSISGTAGATKSNITANATIGTKTVAVATQSFSSGQWVRVEDSQNSELQQIQSISGNTLTMNGKFKHTYRSAATVKRLTLVYPAEVIFENITLRGSSATQGIGVAATLMVESKFGRGVVIENFARAGIKTTNSEQNKFDAVIRSTKSVSSGFGYGVHLSGKANYDNEVGGVRYGITKDVDEGGVGNKSSGVDWQSGSSSAASGMVDPWATFYRTRKPELSYVTYGATFAVSCPASANAPSDVYINGRIYRNYGTVLCDISRTKTPSTATVGGLDRGPATATRTVYLYGVPTQNPSATRAWDLMASLQSQATGPTASATFPAWTWLGAVSTGSSATVRLNKFAQAGDFFKFNRQFVVASTIVGAAFSTWRQVTAANFPVGAKMLWLKLDAGKTSYVRSSAEVDFRVGPTDAVQVGDHDVNIHHPGHTLALGASIKPSITNSGWCRLRSNRYIAYFNNTAATSLQENVYLFGYQLDRSAYK